MSPENSECPDTVAKESISRQSPAGCLKLETFEGLTPKKELALILTLAAIQFVAIMGFMIMMPLGPQLIRLFHLSPGKLGSLISAYTISGGAFGFLSAFFIDRFDRKTALLGAFTGFVGGTFATAFADSFHTLMSARILAGAFGGILGALILSIIGDVIPLARRGTAMGKVMAAFNVASVLGIPFGLYLANIAGWHMPFIVLGGIGIAVTVGVAVVVPPLRTHLIGRPTGSGLPAFFRQLFKSTSQMMAMALIVILVLGQFTVLPYLAPYLVSNVGFTERQLPYIYFVGGLFSIFTTPLIGWIVDRFGRHRIFSVSIALSLIPIYLLTNMGPTPLWVAIVVTTSLFIVMGGRMIPAMTMITSAVSPRFRGSFMSINTALQLFTSGLAASIGGAIIVKGPTGTWLHYDTVGYIAATASVIAIFVASRIKPAEGG